MAGRHDARSHGASHGVVRQRKWRVGQRYIRGYATYEKFVAMCDQEAGGSGSTPKRTRTYIPREREEAE
ncbi:hypothetical protein Tco_1261244 [Tanacetum coccineum]